MRNKNSRRPKGETLDPDEPNEGRKERDGSDVPVDVRGVVYVYSTALLLGMASKMWTCGGGGVGVVVCVCVIVSRTMETNVGRKKVHLCTGAFETDP